MRKLASILALLAFAVTFATAQNATPAAKASGAAIAFEKETIDYGVIQQNAEPVRIFKFKNTGTEPLIIKNAQGSCGCTVPTYPTEPILPGQTGEIKVKYDTSRIGKFSKRVTLTTNSNPETVVLTINGEVLKKEAPQGVPGAEKNLFNNNN
ncbi:MAG: DUF1573 domain-containing protein [Saprospiraceae bacterium]